MAAESEPTQILGSGSYGMVFKPALPNTNINAFPGEVSKIFYRKYNRNKALIASNTIKKHVPSLNIPFKPYNKKYTIKNLPQRVKNSLRGKNTDEVFITRMPELGYSMADIAIKPELYNQFHLVSNEKICIEILKLLNVIKDIKNAGYIHGDIREPNVLFNFKNNKMTIIDFDWFMPANIFLEKFVFYYYNQPPELYLLKNFKIFEIKDKISFLQNLYLMLNNEAFDNTLKYIKWIDINQFKKILHSVAFIIWKYIHESGVFPNVLSAYNATKNAYFKSVDMYGLGLMLNNSLLKMLTFPKHKSLLIFLKNELIVKIMNPIFFKRIYIEEAIYLMENFIKTISDNKVINLITNDNNILSNIGNHTRKNSRI
jgi:serine/threonine protein kinase